MASNTLASLMVRIGADVTEFNKGIGRMESSLKQLRNLAVLDLFNSLNNNPFVQLGKDAVVMAAKFETAFLKIKNLTGVNAKDLATYQNSVKVISNKVGVSALSLAESLYTITSSGAEGSKALEILETAAKGAAVGMGEVDQVAKALTATTNAYASVGLQAARAAEILFNTTKAGNLDIKDLTSSLSNVTPLAAEMGVSLEQVGAFLATVSKGGTSASEGITQLSAILSAILAPSEQAKKVLDDIGISSQELRDLAGKDLHAALLKLKDGFKGNSEAAAAFFGRKEAILGFYSALGTNAGFYNDTIKDIVINTRNLDSATGEALESSEKKWARFTTRATNSLLEGGVNLIKVIDRLTKVYDSLPVLNPFFKKDPTDIVAEINQITAAMDPLFRRFQVAAGLEGISAIGDGVSAISLPYKAPKKTTGGGGGFNSNEKAIKKEIEQTKSLEQVRDDLVISLSKLGRETLSYGLGLGSLKLINQQIYDQELKIKQIRDASSQQKFDVAPLPTSGVKAIISTTDPNVLAPSDETITRTVRLRDLYTEIGEQFARIGQASVEAFSTLAAELLTGALAFKDLGKSALEAARQIVKAALAEALASVIAKSIGKLGILGIGVAVAGLALVSSLFKSKVPKLAKGAAAFTEGLAIIGDNPGARHDPEIVSPISILRKELAKELRNPINKLGGGAFSGNSVNVSGSFTVAGSDLVLVLDRNKFVQSRQRGY